MYFVLPSKSPTTSVHGGPTFVTFSFLITPLLSCLPVLVCRHLCFFLELHDCQELEVSGDLGLLFFQPLQLASQRTPAPH